MKMMKEEGRKTDTPPTDSSITIVKKAVNQINKDDKQDDQKLEKKPIKKWIEVTPYGLVGGMIPNLCLMVFKEKTGSKRFAVPLSRLQGRISVHQSMNKEEPFRFINELLNSMKVKVEECYFLKCENSHISVQVIVSGHPTTRMLNLSAEDVIPFAVYSGCRFYCTEQFITDMLDQKMNHPLKKKSFEKPVYLN